MNPAIITRLDLTLAAPEIFILSAACIILLIDLFLDERTRWESFVLSLFALAGAAACANVALRYALPIDGLGALAVCNLLLLFSAFLIALLLVLWWRFF